MPSSNECFLPNSQIPMDDGLIASYQRYDSFAYRNLPLIPNGAMPL